MISSEFLHYIHFNSAQGTAVPVTPDFTLEE